jgi:ABC-type metal ion transport system substrate-binding protein
MFGKILRPDGNISYIRDGARIVVPDDPTNMVSAKTVVFLTSVEDIEIAPEIISSYGD